VCVELRVRKLLRKLDRLRQSDRLIPKGYGDQTRRIFVGTTKSLLSSKLSVFLTGGASPGWYNRYSSSNCGKCNKNGSASNGKTPNSECFLLTNELLIRQSYSWLILVRLMVMLVLLVMCRLIQSVTIECRSRSVDDFFEIIYGRMKCG